MNDITKKLLNRLKEVGYTRVEIKKGRVSKEIACYPDVRRYLSFDHDTGECTVVYHTKNGDGHGWPAIWYILKEEPFKHFSFGCGHGQTHQIRKGFTLGEYNL